MADYSKLSESDLEAIVNNDWNKVSEEGLKALVGERPKQRTIPEELMRQLGLTGRAAIQGGLGLSSLIAQAPVSAIDLAIAGGRKLTGANVPTLGEIGVRPLEAGKNIATLLGLPEPQSKSARMAGHVAEALTGVGATTIPAKILAQTGVSPVTRAVSQQLAENPQLQMLAGAGSASAAELAKERGAGPGGQFMAAMAGGMLVPGGAAAGQASGRALREIVRPGTEAGREVITGNVLRSLAADAERAIIAAEGYQPQIPGYRPTTAQATRDIGLASAETPIRGLDQTGKFAQQQIEANRARMAILDRLAKDEEALDAAIQKRKDVTRPLREEAFAKVTVDPETFRSGLTLTANKTINNILESDTGARSAVEKAMNWAQGRLQKATTVPRAYSVRQDLRDAAQGLYDKEEPALRLANKELETLIRVMDDTIESAAPGYKDYLEKYAASSRGIERMEAAQKFRGKVMSTIPDPSNLGEYVISQPSFTRAIRAAAEDTKLSKTQLAVLNRVSQDIDSGVLAKAARVPGSDTFKNLSTANIIGGIIGKQMYGDVPPALSKLMAPMNWLYNGTDDAIRQLLVDAMLDPQLAAKMMRRASQASVEPLSEELKKKALSGGLGTAFGLE